MVILRYFLFLLILLAPSFVGAQSFSIQGPSVDPADFEITTFADGLSYPVGMAELSDGSILVGVTEGPFFSGSGELVRLVDTDSDGVADEQMVLYDDISLGPISDVRIANDLVFVTGQRTPVQVLRLGQTANDPLSFLGEIDIEYPGRWLHPHSALAARPSPANPEDVELYFQLGSDANFSVTERQVSVSGFGLQDELINGDSVYRMTFTNTNEALVASDLTQIATGLRNAAGLEFDNAGNLYLEDNGIDGFQNANEPESADELNLILAAEIGGEIEDFGFPFNYTQYRTNEIIGDDSAIAPLAAFQPIGDPLTGAEGEGPNDIALAPEEFPDYLNNGVFVTMHGKFSLGGLENEENPLIFVDLEDNSFFHFISNEEPLVGHIDGLLTTTDSLYLADISDGGFSGSSNNSGAIYKIRGVPESFLADVDGDGELTAEDAAAFCASVPASQREAALAEFGSVLGDLDFDGNVDFSDFLALSDSFGSSTNALHYSTGDIDCNGEVSFADFLVLSSNFGHSTAVSVPEPAAISLLGFGMLLPCLRSRRQASCCD